ncbi:Hypothetical predicted protein, partial [Paramuricea clavata]
ERMRMNHGFSLLVIGKAGKGPGTGRSSIQSCAMNSLEVTGARKNCCNRGMDLLGDLAGDIPEGYNEWSLKMVNNRVFGRRTNDIYQTQLKEQQLHSSHIMIFASQQRFSRQETSKTQKKTLIKSKQIHLQALWLNFSATTFMKRAFRNVGSDEKNSTCRIAACEQALKKTETQMTPKLAKDADKKGEQGINSIEIVDGKYGNYFMQNIRLFQL